MGLIEHRRVRGQIRRAAVRRMSGSGFVAARVEAVEPRVLLSAAPAEKSHPLGKLGDALSGVHAEFTSFKNANPGRADEFRPADKLVRTRGDLVAVEAVATTGDAKELLKKLRTLGLREGQAAGAMAGGLMPIDALDELAETAGVQFARPAWYTTHAELAASGGGVDGAAATSAADAPVTHAGNTTSQADAAMQADVARATYGVNGTGSIVGVISDSFNTSGNGSYGTDQSTRDLPTGVNVLADQANGTDEGRAMLQLVHDVAPGAGLAFHTAGFSQPAFANGITALRNAGADVIVDDVLFLAEPMFQDGVIAQAVDTAVAAGVPYFSAAGNMDRKAYESPFRAGTTLASGTLPVSGDQAPVTFYGGTAHDFNPSTTAVDSLQAFTLDPGQSILLSFQWDSAYRSAGPAGSGNDMDVYVLNAAGNTVVGGSASGNVGGDPVELFEFINKTGVASTFNLMLTSAGGPTPGYLKYVNFGSQTFTEFNTNSGTIYGHANAAGASAVAAAFYGDTPEFGINPARVEPFSSRGGTPVYFNASGTRLTSPALREKPRITAPDGTNTTFFGADIGFDADTYPNFFGTSAAAPHAAAVAALMQDAAGFIAPSAIYRALESTAGDMDDPDLLNFQAGRDDATGFGLVRADLAVGAVASVTLRAVADAYVRDGSAYTGTNYGSSTLLQVKQGPSGYTRHAYLRFDLSNAASVGSAKLRMFGKLDNTASSSVAFRVFDATNTTWGETTINFTNKPVAGTTVRGSGTVTGTTARWYEVDLTSFIRAEKSAGRNLVTLVIKPTVASSSVILFDSDEAANPPQLVVTPAAAPPQGLVVSASNLSVPEGGSASFTVKLAAQPTSNVAVNVAKVSGSDPDLTTATTALTFTSANWNVAQAVSVAAAEDLDTTSGAASFTVSSAGLTSKRVGATEADNDAPAGPVILRAGADAYVRDGATYTGTNYGSSTLLQVKQGPSGYTRHAYLRFDLSNAASVGSAKLRMFGKLDNTASSSVAFRVFDATNTTWGETTINFTNKPVAGTTVRGSGTVTGTTARWYEVDLTSFIRAEKSAGRNLVTLVIKPTAESSSVILFDSDEGVNQPELAVS